MKIQARIILTEIPIEVEIETAIAAPKLMHVEVVVDFFIDDILIPSKKLVLKNF